MESIHGIRTVYQVSQGAYDDWSHLGIFENREDADALAAAFAGDEYDHDQRVVTPMPLFSPGQYQALFVDDDWAVWSVHLNKDGSLLRAEARGIDWLHYVWTNIFAGWSGSTDFTYGGIVIATNADDAVAQVKGAYDSDPERDDMIASHDEWLALPDRPRFFFPWLRGEEAA